MIKLASYSGLQAAQWEKSAGLLGLFMSNNLGSFGLVASDVGRFWLVSAGFRVVADGFV